MSSHAKDNEEKTYSLRFSTTGKIQMWKRTVGLRCFVAVEHVFKRIFSDKVALINSDSCMLVPLSQIK